MTDSRFKMRRTKRFIALFLWGLLIILLAVPFFGKGERVVAQDAEVTFSEEIPTIVHEGVTYPDWNNLSLSSIPPVQSAGGADLSALTEQLGYDPSRYWEAGERIENILQLGDLQSSTNLSDWNLATIASVTDLDLDAVKLSDFGLLKNQTVEDLVLAVPGLLGAQLSDVQPVFDVAKTAFGAYKAYKLGKQTLGSLLEQKTLGNLSDNYEVFGSAQLTQVDLSQYDLKSVPNVEQAKFSDFQDWEETKTSEIPGLKYVSMANYILGLVTLPPIAKIDVVYGEKEANRTNTVSGSFEEGFNVPCNKESCPYIELTDEVDLPVASAHGKQWICGKAQDVSGGEGCLKWVNGGREPTGRNPFGNTFKVVLSDTDESKGEAKFSVYFRFCKWCGCTPYFLGPFPWFPLHEKDLVILGYGGGGGGSQVPPNLPPVPENPFGSPSADDFSEGTYPSEASNQEHCTTYKGVNIGALKQAIANQESSGGNYNAVGPYRCADGGKNCGRALGKYQFMSYREDVEGIFARKQGGRELLQRIRANAISESEIKSQLFSYFPAAVQEQFGETWFRRLINLAQSQGYTGIGLIDRVGGMQNAGENGYAGGFAKGTVAQYQKEFPKSQQKCQASKKEKNMVACTRKFNHPAPSYSISGSGGRFGACRPVGLCKRRHEGLDFATPIGTSVQASDNGQVSFVGFMQGYGLAVDINHCGKYTTRYAHLSKSLVNFGQTVSQGQIIAKSGNTGVGTGPHLHFEIRVGGRSGQAQDPEKILKGYGQL